MPCWGREGADMGPDSPGRESSRPCSPLGMRGAVTGWAWFALVALWGLEGQCVLASEAWVNGADEEETFPRKALSEEGMQGLAGLGGSAHYANSPAPTPPSPLQ